MAFVCLDSPLSAGGVPAGVKAEQRVLVCHGHVALRSMDAVGSHRAQTESASRDYRGLGGRRFHCDDLIAGWDCRQPPVSDVPNVEVSLGRRALDVIRQKHDVSNDDGDLSLIFSTINQVAPSLSRRIMLSNSGNTSCH